MTIWMNGKFCTKDEAKVSVYDHGFLYGDGVFEGLRVYGGKIFKLEEHIDRLFKGMHFLLLSPPYDKVSLCNILNEVVAEHKEQTAYIRLVITRGEGSLGLDPTTCGAPSTVIIVDNISLYPALVYKEGITLITSSLRRLPLDSFDVRVKSMNYLNNVMARLEAKRANAHEAILLNHQGMIAECSGDNLILVKNGELFYPDPACGALEGITLGVFIELAQKLGIPAHKAQLGLYDLYTADEALLTGTAAEIVPIKMADGRVIGNPQNRPMFEKLKSAFTELQGRK